MHGFGQQAEKAMANMAFESVTERAARIKAFLDSMSAGKLSDIERCYVMFALGSLRAEESIPVLIEALETRGDIFDVDALPPFGKYPAAEALVRIGGKSVQPLIDKIDQNAAGIAADELHKLIYRVIITIDGRDVIKFKLENRLRHATTEESRSRLKEAVRNAADANVLHLPGETREDRQSKNR
jgi:hypothetical protein